MALKITSPNLIQIGSLFAVSGPKTNPELLIVPMILQTTK